MNERERHHVAIGHMRDLMAEHSIDLVGAHGLQQPGADRHQRMVAAGAGGKGIGLRRLKDAHFRHADAGLERMGAHGVE